MKNFKELILEYIKKINKDTTSEYRLKYVKKDSHGPNSNYHCNSRGFINDYIYERADLIITRRHGKQKSFVISYIEICENDVYICIVTKNGDYTSKKFWSADVDHSRIYPALVQLFEFGQKLFHVADILTEIGNDMTVRLCDYRYFLVFNEDSVLTISLKDLYGCKTENEILALLCQMFQ